MSEMKERVGLGQIGLAWPGKEDCVCGCVQEHTSNPHKKINVEFAIVELPY